MRAAIDPSVLSETEANTKQKWNVISLQGTPKQDYCEPASTIGAMVAYLIKFSSMIGTAPEAMHALHPNISAECAETKDRIKPVFVLYNNIWQSMLRFTNLGSADAFGDG